MGLGGISIWQLLIVLLIVAMLFGTKRLKGLGSDLGGAIKGFKKSVSDDSGSAENLATHHQEIDKNRELSHNKA